MDTSKDVSAGEDTQPRASAESAAARGPAVPAAPAGSAAGVATPRQQGRASVAREQERPSWWPKQEQQLRLGVYPEERNAHGPHRTCMGTVRAAWFGSTKAEATKTCLNG